MSLWSKLTPCICMLCVNDRAIKSIMYAGRTPDPKPRGYWICVQLADDGSDLISTSREILDVRLYELD